MAPRPGPQLPGWAACGGIAALLLVSGCGGAPAPSPDPTPEDPTTRVPAGLVNRDNDDAMVRVYTEDIAACYEEHGYEVVFLSGGGMNIAGSGGTRWREVVESCIAEVGRAPNEVRLSEGQVDALYDFFVDATECLSAEGVRFREPPTRDEFAASYQEVYSGNPRAADPWDPWRNVPITQWEAVKTACPPPTLEELDDRVGSGR